MTSRPIGVLLIEHDLGTVRRFRETLRSAGPDEFVLHVAGSLAEAGPQVGQGAIDVVVVAHSLPDGRGLNVVRRLRAVARDKPLLLLAGTEDEAVAGAAIQQGADDYLVREELGTKALIRTLWYAVERKRWVRQLETSEARLRTIFTNHADAIVVVDSDGVIQLVNPAAESLFGLQREELIEDRFGIPIQAGASVEVDIVNGAGRAIVAEMRVVKTEWDGRPALLASLRDITERKRTEHALAESRRLVQSTLDSLAAAIAILDETGTIKAVNAAWRSHATEFGVPDLSLAVDDNYLEACGAASFEAGVSGATLAEGIREVIQRSQPNFYAEYAVASPDEPEWFAVRVTRFPAGGPIRVVVAHERITDRKQLEEQLLQSQKMEAVGRLAGGVAHDFNNLLTAIQCHTDLLLANRELPERARVNVEHILQAGERGSTLIRHLLLFSRKQIVTPRVIDVHTVVSEMQAILRRLIGEDIELSTRLSSEPLSVKADRGQLEQVVMNLAINSRDAMPDGGRLHIETQARELVGPVDGIFAAIRPGRYAVLSVRDTGSGMNTSTMARIFEPFFTTKDVGKGTGLGLSMVYGIVKQCGGDIVVHSEVGGGSQFEVFLPRVVETVTEADPSIRDPGPSRGGSETILVVEDEPLVRDLACSILQGKGYTILEATNGEDALEVSGGYGGSINLLLTDVVMPKMSGRVLAERLTPARPEVRVLYMSGYTDDAIAQHGVADDGIAYLQKPFTPDALASKVRAVLDAPTEAVPTVTWVQAP